MSFQASCPACAAPVQFDVANSVVTICPNCNSVVGRADGKLQTLGKIADLVQTDSPFQCGLRGKFKGVPFEITGRSQIRHFAGGVWDEWYVAFRGGQRWGWLAEAQGKYYLTFEQPLPEGVEIPPLAELELEQKISIPQMGVLKVVEIGEGVYVSGEGEMPFELTPGEVVSFADLSGGGRKFATLDESNGQQVFYAGGEVTLKDLGVESAANRENKERRVAAVQVNCPQCGGPLDLKAPDQTLRVACPFCAALLSCDQGNLEFLTALQKKNIEPILPLGSKGVFTAEVAGTDWEEPQELTIIGFMHRLVTYEGLDYTWHEYLLYKPRLPFYWLIYNDGHWSFGQSVPAGDVSVSATRAHVGGSTFKIFERGNPKVNYVLGEFYWEVQQGETVDAEDYIAPPLLLSREVSYVSGPPKKGSRSKSGNKNREINYTVSRYVPVEEIEKAFEVEGLRQPSSIAPNQPYPYKDIYKVWGWMCLAALFLVMLVTGTRSSKQVYRNSFTIPAANPRTIKSRTTVSIESGKNIAVSLGGTQWVHIAGKLLEQTDNTPIPGSEFGVFTDKTVYLDALPPGEYNLEFYTTWRNATSITSSPTFWVTIKQDVPHFSQMFWLFAGVMVIPFCVLLHHGSFDTRRWKDSDFSPYNTE